MVKPPREHPAKSIEPPPSLLSLVQGYEWARDTVGESGDEVFRLYRPKDDADLYLKHGKAACAVDLAGEMVRLRWLGSRITVPEVRHFIASADEAWLLMTALPGRTAYQVLETCPAGRPALIGALATYLQQLHAIPVESCPFNSDHRLRLVEARWRLDAGLVDEGGFDTARRRRTAQEVWDEMTGLLPSMEDRVVTHGDFSLDNIIVDNGAVVGCIDVGRAGIADRYQDIAILWNCLGDFGPDAQDQLFAAYGIDEPDAKRIQFHLLLDQLF